MKKKLLISMLFISFKLFSQCNPLEVALFISERDGWMFPYSTFYWGMSDAMTEIAITNPECKELLDLNSECIQNCMFLTTDESDAYLGRIGCIYYNCQDGNELIQNYEYYMENPFFVYGQNYCSEGTEWNDVTNRCESIVCNGDFNEDNEKNVQDIVIMVNEILNNNATCE